MGLIKSNVAPQALAAFSMRDVENHAKQIIIRAQQKAEQLLAAAQEQAEQLALAIREEAYQDGFVQGRTKGTEEGVAAGKTAAIAEFKAKFETSIDLLNKVATDFDQQKSDFESQAFTDVIQLAVSIARRVTQQAAAVNPEVVTENVRQAVRLVSQQSSVAITIHPAQKQFLDEMLPQLKKSWPKVTHIELLTDEAIQPGGCRVTGGGCEVNAELDQQIDRIVADILPSEPAA